MICELCSQDVEELIRVDDSDRSVGYVDELRICEDCLDERRAA